MRLALLIAAVTMILAGFAFSQLPRSGAVAQSSVGKATETRFYCDRSAIAPDQLKRKVELGQVLRSSVRHVRELPDGFEFELGRGPGGFQEAAEWASLERLCCPFFDIGLQLRRQQGPTLLRLTGEAGVKQFIQAEFGPGWFENTGGK